MLFYPRPFSVPIVQDCSRVGRHQPTDLERNVRRQPGLFHHPTGPPIRLHLGLGHEMLVRLALLRFLRHFPHPIKLKTLLWHPRDGNVFFLRKEIVSDTEWLDLSVFVTYVS